MNQAGENLVLQTVLRAILVAANQNSWRALDATLTEAKVQLDRLEVDKKRLPRLTRITGRIAS